MALRVIGAGYGRTGTASLKLALERLGFGPCHHMSEVLPNPERIALWTTIGQQSANGGVDPALWDEAFAGYDATVDWPSCTHWRALVEHAPESKVILSRRSAESWFDSVHHTILNPDVWRALRTTPMGPMLEANIERLFDGRMDDREHMIACFERHCDEVAEGVPADRLLVFEAKDGWGPLCEFLGVPVPEGDFPRVNSKEETRKVMQELRAQVEQSGATQADAGFADDIYAKGQE
ncbi:MAG: sulfotransferase family protein [Planctomycetota bacterium]|jgi:hypothetical protein